jgi:CHAD domain-containing protein
MAYRIDIDKPLESEVRRIASAQLSSAADLLEHQPEGPHTAIHDARRHIKRTRALYRLIASEASDFVSTENKRLREIARDLSHLRDTAALAETTAYLASETEHKESVSAIKHLGRAMKTRRDEMAIGEEAEAELADAATRLREAENATEGLHLPGNGKQAIACVAAGWRKTGKRARKALDSCQDAEDEVPFHDLRKRSQDRWMHSALLRKLWPAAMISVQKQTKALVDLLGHEHDLAVLNDHLASPEHTRKNEQEQQSILQSIAAQRQKLQQASRDAGGEIYGDKPKKDDAVIRTLWRLSQR